MILYQYKGGGYDGCWWEWNFFLMHNGQFHNILTTGRNGIKTKEEALKVIDNEEYNYKYDLHSADDLNEFATENSHNLIAPVGLLVNRILNKRIMYFICSYCGEKVYPLTHGDYPEYFHDENDYCGDGGVGIAWGSTICEDCYCHRCEDCDSIISPDDKGNFHNDRCLCEYCYKEATKELDENCKE